MKVTLLGASGGEVTGSAYLLQTGNANVLIDCGLFQGAQKLENYNHLPKRGPLQDLDCVVLTHAHLDHTGRLPLLTRFGYSGPIYATPATIDLTGLILRDSAHLQREDVKRQNRRRAEQGKPPIEPLYTAQQVDQLQPLSRHIFHVEADVGTHLLSRGRRPHCMNTITNGTGLIHGRAWRRLSRTERAAVGKLSASTVVLRVS